MKWKDHLIASLGYHELGMQRDALTELDRLSGHDGNRIEVAGLRLSILQALGEWQRGAELARRAVEPHPETGSFFLTGAYCIRRFEGIEAAFAFLEQGQSCLEDEPCFWFNLGCYHCQLGRMKKAQACVEKAIGLDDHYRKLAEEDPDLEPLRDLWAPGGE